jgi:hypothetical protein
LSILAIALVLCCALAMPTEEPPPPGIGAEALDDSVPTHGSPDADSDPEVEFDYGQSSVEDDRSCVHLAYDELSADPRTQHVYDFLDRHSCSITHLAPSFVLAADLNDLDYRLLPTLAVLESGCGRAARNHNLFGWANGRKPFGSFEHAIHFVAQRLRLAPHYRNKTTIEKLRLYNRRPAYRAKVLRLMDTIGAEESPEAGSEE